MSGQYPAFRISRSGTMAETKYDGVEKREKATVFGLHDVREVAKDKVLAVVSREGMVKINKPGGSYYGDEVWQPAYQGVSGAGYVVPRTDFGPEHTVDPTGN